MQSERQQKVRDRRCGDPCGFGTGFGNKVGTPLTPIGALIHTMTHNGDAVTYCFIVVYVGVA
jgi:hypothetical protein